MGIVVDTSILVALEREAVRASGSNVGRLPDDGALAAITISELRVGILLARSDSRRGVRERLLADIIRHMPILPFGASEAEVHAGLRVQLRRSGMAVGAEDLIIAATAMANGHSVMTLNLREFQQIPGLDVLAGPQPAAE